MNPDTQNIRRDPVTHPGPVNALRQTTAQSDNAALAIWSPMDVSMPTPGKNGCTHAFTSLDELLAELTTKNPAVAGIIWIGKNYDSATTGDGHLLCDGRTLTKMAQYALTIHGGWKGPGASTLDVNAPSSLAGISLIIINWVGNVTLRNIRVQNVTAGGHSGAVSVGTEGSIQLDRILAYGNSVNGVTLDNTASVSSPPSSVTVTNCQFLDNHAGLMIGTKGAVNLSNVLAQDNAHRGAFIDNTYGSEDVYLRGTNAFLGNGSHGLEVDSNGQVGAKDLVAYANGLSTSANGVYISAKKAVTVIGSGKFKGNGGNGLEVSSNGTITAQNLTAIANEGSGLWLTTTISANADGQAMTLNGVNADGNSHSGIVLYADGRLSLGCSSAYDNKTSGLYVRGATNNVGPATGLTLQGFIAYLNGTNEDVLTSNRVVRTVCP